MFMLELAAEAFSIHNKDKNNINKLLINELIANIMSTLGNICSYDNIIGVGIEYF
jgi:hypothetical protein